MTDVQTTYLGWETFSHYDGCARPAWDVTTRRETDYRRGPGCGEPAHSCPNEDCGHDGRYERVTVRIVCRSCGIAHLVAGEELSQRTVSTGDIGYGQPPRKASRLLLWPDAPLNTWVRDPEPWGFLVTRAGVTRVTEVDAVGIIGQGRGRRGGVCWWAGAAPSPDGPYGNLGRLRWARRSEGHKSPGAAAKWIAAQLAEAEAEAADGGDPR